MKTRKELAYELGISTRTLYRWLKQRQISIPTGLICPKVYQSIIQKLTMSDFV